MGEPSSVVTESNNTNDSGKDVDSKSEDEDKRDMEARRLKDEDIRKKEEKDEEDRNSLAAAVRLVQNMGGIAIKRLESKTSEDENLNEKDTVNSSLASSLSDRITISVRKELQNDS